jgi:hypothetical protein
VSCRTLTETRNPQNQNAGNGGDLVKHTVYLTILDYLLHQEPWATELRVRECHAGRGLYEIPAGDVRRPSLKCLYDPVHGDVEIPLHDIERASQTALNVWPQQRDTLHWYSGSAIVNAWCMANAGCGNHLLELYELAPDTRTVLRAVFADPGFQFSRLKVRILPEPEDGCEFDGELQIERSIAGWVSQDLILLDPFAMWRRRRHQCRRDLYRRIFDRLLALPEPPPLVLFWTWGRAFKAAVGDIEGARPPVRNGYQELRQLLHTTDRSFIRVSWRWGLQFAMWIVVPAAHLQPLEEALQWRCNEIRDHLLNNGCRLINPDIRVTVD